MLADELKEIREAGLLLGFQEGDQVDLQTIRRTYTKFAHDWHPDHATNNGVSAAEANAKMAAGNKAFSVLKKAAEKNGGGTVRIPTAQEAEPEPTYTQQSDPYSYQSDPYQDDYSTGRGNQDEPTDYDRPTWTVSSDDPDPHSGFNYQTSTAQTSTAQSNTTQTSTSSSYTPMWVDVLKDIAKPVISGPVRMAPPPLMLLYLIHLAIEGFFIFLLIASFRSHPLLTVLISPILVGMVWFYRMIARLVFQIAEISSLLTLAIDVALIGFIWWRYGPLLVAIFSPYFSNLPSFSATS